MNSVKLYKLIREVAEYVAREVWGDGYIGQHAYVLYLDPALHQTKSGLALETFNGLANSLWTPWGKWFFVGPTQRVVSEKVIQALGAVRVEVEGGVFFGEENAEARVAYALTHCACGRKLPPLVLRDRADWIPLNEAKGAWSAFKRTYSPPSHRAAVWHRFRTFLFGILAHKI